VRTFKVGGCVRDSFLGRDVHDFDYVVVGSSVDEMLSLGFKQVGKGFPVFLHPETKEEYALARTERKSGNGYYGFEAFTESVTLEEDLLRRDLTVNAMAVCVETGELFDPFGGLKDLKEKILRPVSPAFKEDPLRVLRVARFRAVLGRDWTVAQEVYSFARELREELKTLTKERVYKETMKAFRSEDPTVFFETLRDLGVLDVLFPELHEMVSCEHENEYHLEGSVFNHTMMALKLCNFDESRWAVLFHDVAKPFVKAKYGKMHGHDDEEVLEGFFNRVKERYSLSREEFETARFVAVNHHRFHYAATKEMRASKVLDLVMQVKTFERMERVVDAVYADMFGRVGVKEAVVDRSFFLNLWRALKEHRTDCTGLSVEQIRARVREERLRIVRKIMEEENVRF
jgi:tRNA nucleotidyltransferase (CCA-adding enzyme)